MEDPVRETPEAAHEALALALAQRDALKEAGDALVHALSHPTRDGRRLMDAIVAYRRISEQLDEESGTAR